MFHFILFHIVKLKVLLNVMNLFKDLHVFILFHLLLVILIDYQNVIEIFILIHAHHHADDGYIFENEKQQKNYFFPQAIIIFIVINIALKSRELSIFVY